VGAALWARLCYSPGGTANRSVIGRKRVSADPDSTRAEVGDPRLEEVITMPVEMLTKDGRAASKTASDELLRAASLETLKFRDARTDPGEKKSA
jgi:hypothetical protein